MNNMPSGKNEISLKAAVRHFADHACREELERLEGLGAFVGPQAWILEAPETENQRLCRQYGSLLKDLEKQLVERLSSGELIGSGYFSNQPPKRTPVSADLWQFLDVDFGGSKASETGFTISGIMVREDRATRRVASTVKGEKDCKAWLLAEIEQCDTPPLKTKMRKTALKLFGPKLSGRGFDRIWDEVAPASWKKKGRRKETKQ